MVKELIQEAAVDARRLSLPLAVVLSVLASFSGIVIVFAAWGLHGNVQAWKMQTEREFLQTVSEQRAEDLDPIKKAIEELIEIVRRQETDAAPFKKNHYEALRKTVGVDWPIYDDLDAIARGYHNNKY